MAYTVASQISYTETEIKNVSTKDLFFGFIPPHGKRLAAGAKVSFEGDLETFIARRKRYIDALHNSEKVKNLVRVTENLRHVVYVDVLSASVIVKGDLVWYDSATDTVKSAADYVWAGSLAATQAAFSNDFLGVALDDHASLGGNVLIRVDISPESYWDFASTLEVHNLNDTLGPAKNPSSNALLANKLELAVAASAIARPVRRDAVASDTCFVNVESAFWGSNVNSHLGT